MKTPELSVVIVNYNVRDFLVQTISSLFSSSSIDAIEIIVVDNNSHDGSQEHITALFPSVTWIGLDTNVGFGSACNRGARKARAPHLLMLNPDTIVSSDTIQKALAFFNAHPDAGIVGPKILNEDGSFQFQCRRSFPTPLNALSHFTGLSTLFPDSKVFGAYSLTWAPIDEQREVDAVSGACLFITTDLYTQIGGFDEAFFMYGEDIDLCMQVKKRGYKVYYSPQSYIIHFKGKSSAQRVIKSRIAFYEAMLLFSKKHKKSYGSFLTTGLLSLGIFFKALLHIATILMKSLPVLLADLGIINSSLFLVTTLRYTFLSIPNPYLNQLTTTLLVHLLMSGIYVTTFALANQYRGVKTTPQKTALACVISFTTFLASLLMVRTIAYSRLSIVGSALLTSVLLFSWRQIVPKFKSISQRYRSHNGKTIIIGESNAVQELLPTLLKNQQGYIRGIITPQPCDQKEISLFPVLGSLNTLATTISQFEPDTILIIPTSSTYSTIISALETTPLSAINLLWHTIDRE